MPDDQGQPNALAELLETDEISRRRLLAAGAGLAAGAILARHTTAEPLAQPATAPTNAQLVTLSVNGRNYALHLEPRVTLLDALRESAGLTGTKKGCDHGQCGACTVLVDGRRINSCMTLAIMHQHQAITTIEGIAASEKLHPVQQAFIEHDAFQCGYCTPGQICSAVGLIHEGRASTDDEIREGMSGNLCRCGAYVNIVAAVRDAMNHK